MPFLERNTLIFQRYLIGHWHMDDYTIVTFQAVSRLRPVGSIDSTPDVDAGPSQAAVQNAILIDSEASADVRSTIMSFDPFLTFDPQAYPQARRPSLNFSCILPKLANFLAKRRLKSR